MAKQIDVDTLRDWLDRQRPVTLIDVRPDEDFEEWTVPGSIHIDASEALREGQPGALADAALPRDRPVVTVCGAGRTSQVAADYLAARGYDARSLAGGMKAWSLAWNEAMVSLSDTRAHVIQVRRTGKGCLSYVVGSRHEAVVIDPSVASDVYVQLAKRHGWSIRYVLDTHVHADHLSRAIELVRLTGATLVMPPQKRVAFAFTPLEDGQELRFGDASIKAVHTPGHTPESTCYALNDSALFTGDTLFTNSVGRPDLAAHSEDLGERARALYRSLTELKRLRPEIVVLPGHTADPVPFDGRPIAATLGEVNGWLSDWLASEGAFVDRVTSELPPTPPNFVQIVGLNSAGEMPDGDPTDLEAGANRCAVR